MSLLRKGIYASGGSIICTCLDVATNMILARALLPEGMGRYQLPIIAATIAVTITSLGIGQANIYFLNRHNVDPKQVVMNSIWVGFMGSFLLIVFLPILFASFPKYFGIFPLWISVLFSLGVSFSYAINLVRPLLMAALKVRQAVHSQVINRFVVLAAVCLGSLFNILSVNIALFIFAIGNFSSLLLLVFYLRRQISSAYSFRFQVFREQLKYGLKLYIANLLEVTNMSIAILLLRYLIPNNFSDIGYYGRAVSLCGLVLLIPRSVGPLLYAKWSGISTNERKAQVELTMRLYLYMCLALVSGLIIFSHWIVLVVYGEHFLPSVPALRILSVGIALRAMFDVCNKLLASDGLALITAIIFGISAIIIGALTWLLVPQYGINGAALSNMFSGFVLFSIQLAILRKKYGVHLENVLLPKKNDVKCFFALLPSQWQIKAEIAQK